MTPKTAPMGVFIDCTDQPVNVDALRLGDEIHAALRAGDHQVAAGKSAELADVLAAHPAAVPETVRQLTDDEHQALVDGQVDATRHHMHAQVDAALAQTTEWLHDAVETGKPLAKPRAAHRQKLRSLHDQIDAAKTLDQLAKIEIPEPPNGAS